MALKRARLLATAEAKHYIRHQAMPIVKAASGVYCDTCKDRFGYIRNEAGQTVPHPKGRRQAYSTIISETHYGKEPVIRSLCYSCIDDASRWHDGSIWTLAEQIQYAKDNRNGQQLRIGSMTNGI
jgi:hypothetical protein